VPAGEDFTAKEVNSLRIKKVFGMCLFRVRNEVFRKIALVGIACVMLYFYNRIADVAAVCNEYGYKPTLPGIAFVTNDSITQLVIMTGAVVMFSDAPFRSRLYYQLAYRTGKIGWAVGNIMGIIALAFIYIAFIMLVYFITLLPCAEYSMKWGQAWRQFAKAAEPGMPVSVVPAVLRGFSGAEAFWYTVLYEFGCVILTGIWIYSGSVLISRKAGLYIGFSFILLDIAIWNSLPGAFTYISPVSLARIESYASNGLSMQMHTGYGAAFYAVGIALGCVTIILSEVWKNDKSV